MLRIVLISLALLGLLLTAGCRASSCGWGCILGLCNRQAIVLRSNAAFREILDNVEKGRGADYTLAWVLNNNLYHLSAEYQGAVAPECGGNLRPLVINAIDSGRKALYAQEDKDSTGYMKGLDEVKMYYDQFKSQADDFLLW